MSANPYEVVEIMRKVKKFKLTGAEQCQRLVKRLKLMNLSNEVLAVTQVPRVLLWVVNRTKDYERDEPFNILHRMCKHLCKVWRQQFQSLLKKEHIKVEEAVPAAQKP